MADRVGLTIYADTGQIKKLGERFGLAARVVRPTFRRAALIAAQPIVADIKARSSFSHRIPASVHAVMVGNNIEIRAGGASAPDAAPIENHGRGFVRHPVFARTGDRATWVWTSKNSRPAYVQPAVDAGRLGFVLSTEDAVIEALEKAVGGR